MVEDIQISDRGRQVSKKLLFLTTKQAASFNANNIQSVVQALELRESHFIIRLMPSYGGKAGNLAHKERKGMLVEMLNKPPELWVAPAVIESRLDNKTYSFFYSLPQTMHHPTTTTGITTTHTERNLKWCCLSSIAFYPWLTPVYNIQKANLASTNPPTIVAQHWSYRQSNPVVKIQIKRSSTWKCHYFSYVHCPTPHGNKILRATQTSGVLPWRCQSTIETLEKREHCLR